MAEIVKASQDTAATIKAPESAGRPARTARNRIRGSKYDELVYTRASCYETQPGEGLREAQQVYHVGSIYS